MKNKMNYYKLYFSHSLKQSSFYIISIIFTLFLNLNFYIRQQFFTGNGSTDLLLYFSSVPYICIITIPALCAKPSFSVYDSFIPIKNIHRIICHFFSFFSLYLIQLIFIILSVLPVSFFGSIDAGQLFTSIFCLIFYGAVVISLCILLGNIFQNRIITFVISALILGIFNSAHLFAVYVQLPDFFVNICKQLSFAWHFESAGKGILDTRDLLCFTGTTFIFILLSDFISKYKAGKIFTSLEKINISAGLIFSILIILNGSRWYTRIDCSKNKIFSTSAYTRELAGKITEPVKITYYKSSSIEKLYPQIRDISDFLNEYSALSKKISLIIKDPDKDPKTRTLLENYGIQTQQLKTMTSTSTEYLNVYSAITIEYQGNVELIPFTMTANTLEYDLDGRIKHLLNGKARLVNIIIGNGLSLSADYSYLIPWLNAQGFICNELNINNPDFTRQLSQCAGPLLVIGDSHITIEAAIAIEDYILQNRGNAFFNVSPYTVNLEEDWYLTAAKKTNIVEMLENWGCIFLPEIAADISCARITMYSEDNTHTQVINYPLWISLLQQQNTESGITMFWPTALELTEPAEHYLSSSPFGYTYKTDRNSPEKLIETNPFVLETVNTSNLEKKYITLGAKIYGPLKGLYNLASTETASIIVIPDQYFVNSLMNEYIGGDYGDYRNFNFLTSTLLKLNGEEALAALFEKSAKDTSLYKITDLYQFNFRKNLTFIIVFLTIPLLIIISGVIISVFKKQ